MDEHESAIDPQKVKAYAENTGALASAIESMFKTDGWSVFMALFKREKTTIYEKSDYPSLGDFKADRKAIEIVESIIQQCKDFIEDAGKAQELLAGLSPSEGKKERGIFILEAVEDSNRESQ